MSGRLLEGLTGVVGVVLSVLSLAVELGTGTGVVKEHCLNVGASQNAQAVQVDSHWTYVVWPPLNFAAIDPAGRCVRNWPLHEALSAVGIWKLPPPEEQVRRHVLDQVKNQ